MKYFSSAASLQHGLAARIGGGLLVVLAAAGVSMTPSRADAVSAAGGVKTVGNYSAPAGDRFGQTATTQQARSVLPTGYGTCENPCEWCENSCDSCENPCGSCESRCGTCETCCTTGGTTGSTPPPCETTGGTTSGTTGGTTGETTGGTTGGGEHLAHTGTNVLYLVPLGAACLIVGSLLLRRKYSRGM